jgi:large subunit ribosomal protein L25
MTLSLNVTARDARGKENKKVRESGIMPAIVYGPKNEPHAIGIKLTEFKKVFDAAGESTVITLTGLEKDIDVLIHEVDFDPLTTAPRHADFYAIDKNTKIRVHVPIEFVGEAPITKQGGAVTKVLHEIEVEALPMSLPSHITVDVSVLTAFDSQIHMRDITPIAGVEFLVEPDEVVVVASEVKEETEEVPTAIDMSAIEVEKKGKTEAEAEAE